MTKFDKQKYEQARDALHEATHARNFEVIDGLLKLIAKDELVLWIKQSDGSNALVNAVGVSVNGMCVQIEADPTFFVGE
jgi:formiminotetrahydrofolate cyclodeaminase